jgi:putative SOS response-associated peptidase YedK
MCNRYAYAFNWEALWAGLGLAGPVPSAGLAPRYNVAPTQLAPILRRSSRGVIDGVMMRWGFMPRWAVARGRAAPLTNARLEDVATRPTFSEAYRSRRCVVPASAFYEWASHDGRRQPWCFAQPGMVPMAFAGLWESSTIEGLAAETFTILTTSAKGVVARIHDRMPVMLPADVVHAWLDGSHDGCLDRNDVVGQRADAGHVPSRLAMPSSTLQSWAISPRINAVARDPGRDRPGRDRPDLLTPIVLREEPGLFDAQDGETTGSSSEG